MPNLNARFGDAASFDPAPHRIKGGHGERRGGGQKHKIAFFQQDFRFAVHRKKAAAKRHGAKARMAERRVTHRPFTRATDPFRKHRPGAQQADDLFEGVRHSGRLQINFGLIIAYNPTLVRHLGFINDKLRRLI